MEAMISGRTGVALVVDGDVLASIHASDPERMVPRKPSELRFLIGEGRDFVPVENVSREKIVQELLLARGREEALLRALILLDRDLSEELRTEAAGELEEFLAKEDLVLGVEDVLYAEPLPREADLKGALAAARGRRKVLELFDRLSVRQDEICEIREAWNAIPPAEFDGERRMWQFVVVREGLFRQLVLHVASGRNVQETLVEASMRPAVRALPNYRGVLQAWLRPFVQRYSVAREAGLAELRQPSLVAEPTVAYKGKKVLEHNTSSQLDQKRDHMAMSGVLLAGTDVGHSKLASVIEASGYAVYRAASGREALDTGIAKLPEVLLTDWVLADQIPGLQVAAALRLVNPGLKVLLIASRPPVDLRNAAREIGAPPPLAPPIDPERLREALAAEPTQRAQGAGTPVGIICLGADDAILHANPTGRSFLAATRAGADASRIAEILSPAEVASMREAVDEWVEVWPLADPPVPWQVRSRTHSGYDFLVVLAGEQCLTLLETWPGLYATDFLVGQLLDVPIPEERRWPFLGRVLVVDSSRMFRRLAVQEIERVGTLCYSAADREEARRLLADDPSIAVALTDAAILADEGERWLGDLRELRPELLVACYGEPEATAADVACVLPKPWTIESLIYELRQAAL